MLRNRQNTEETKLVGVNLQADQSKLKLGSFTLLQNFIPAKRYKIKKKRGCVALSGSETVTFPTDCDGNESFLSIECGHDCPITQYAEAEIQFAGGEGPGGPAIRVDPASTTGAFTGLAAIYYAAGSKLALVRFDAADLTDVDTIVDSIGTTLNNGDVLRIEASASDPEEYSVLVNGVAVIGPETILDATLSINNSCIGFVGLEAATIP
jgi:hypothetical protein